MSERNFPESWNKYSLVDLAHYHNGYAFKPSDWSEDGVKIVRIEQLNNPEGEYDHYNRYISDINSIDNGDLIFSWSATLKVAIWKHGKAVLNQHLFKVLPKSVIDKLFLFFLLDFNMESLGGGSHGSTMKHIKRSELEKYTVSIPLKKEQKKIASILTSIDNAIEKTEALIDKYRKIKAGLMHDLFTRGVTPDGKLRPPREQAPGLYKETPIGWFPKDWKLIPLGTMSDITSGVTLNSKLTADQIHEVPYLRVANVQDGYLDLNEIKTIFVNKKTIDTLKLKTGDVLMNEGGDFDKLGRGTVWQGEIEPCIHQNHVFRVRVNDKVLRPYYLAFWSESSYGKKYFILSSKQSTNLASINSTQLNAYPILTPAIDEQIAIEERVVAVNERLNTLADDRDKSVKQKQGLMHDLLTGKVPVKVDERERAAV